MSITIELLDCMLAPPTQGQTSSRSDAEEFYNSITTTDRVRGLVQLLIQLQNNASNANNANNAGRSMLAAVLLRREIASLAGMSMSKLRELTSSPQSVARFSSASKSSKGGENSAEVALLGEIAEPLLSLFLVEGDGGDGGSRNARRQIGHCVAELCCTLSLISMDQGKEWMKVVLQRLEPGCIAMDVMFLRLLNDIAERSPVTLWSIGNTDSFSSLFRGIVDNLKQSNQQPSCSLEQLEAAMGSLCQIGIAYEKAKRTLSTQSDNTIEQVLLSQFSTKTTEVDPNSPAAHLGKMILPTMLEALLSFASSPSCRVDTLLQCMSHLSTCSMQCPSMLAGDETSFSSLMRACMAIAQRNNADYDEDVAFLKLSALDVLATICSVPQIKKWVLPRNGTSSLLQFLIHGSDGGSEQKGVLYLCAELITTGVDEDEEGWSQDPATLYDSDASWEGDRTALHAEAILELFVETLGGASTLPHIFRLVETLLATTSWQNHRAVLSMLERCLAAAPVTIVPHVTATVETALNLCPSSSVRVQYQALQLIGSLCCANTVSEDGPSSDHAILVRENYGGRILECLAHLTKSPCTKVASHACLAIVSYCRGGNGSENCMVPIDAELIVPYVGELLNALKSGPLSVDLTQPSNITNGSLTVLTRGIGAVACLAVASGGEEFSPHYGVMGGLLGCAKFGLEKSDTGAIQLSANVRNTHEISMLRGAAIEAATIVGQAVAGPDGENVGVYLQDASEIMTLAVSVLDSSSDVIPNDQLLAACARIAAVMGSQYIPFVPSVLPHLLKKATEKTDISITDSEEGDGKHAFDEDDEKEGYSVSIPGMGYKRVKINTTQLEEKSQAARAVYEHARALGKDFGPFVEASAEAFLPLVDCEYSGDVRATSSQALSQIFKASCLSAVDPSSSNQRALSQKLLPLLAKAFTKQLAKEGEDDDIENRDAIADALSEVMYDSFQHKTSKGERVAQISATDAKEIVPQLMCLIESCFSRRSILLNEITANSSDGDEVARCEAQNESESELLTHLTDSIGFPLKSLGESFAPIFAEHVAGPMGKLLTSAGTPDVRARCAAICLFDDCVEFCGSQAASAYSPMLLLGIVEGIDDEKNDGDKELKQASIYGIAQIARHSPSSIPAPLGQELLAKVYDIAKQVENVKKSDIENAMLVENAVSSMASLALLRGSPLYNAVAEKRSLLNTFLCGLPLQEDDGEAQVCHAGLCDLVESGQINLQSDYGALIRITGEILVLMSEGEDVASRVTCERLLNAIARVQQCVDLGAIQSVFSTLEPEAQQELVKHL